MMINGRIKNNRNFTGALPWMHCETNELQSRMCPGSSGSAVPVSWLWHVCKRSPDTGSREWSVQCQRSRAGSRPPEQSSPDRWPAWVHLSAPCPRTRYTPLPRTTQQHHAEKAHVRNTCAPKNDHCDAMLLGHLCINISAPMMDFWKWSFMQCVTKWMKTSCKVLHLKEHSV